MRNDTAGMDAVRYRRVVGKSRGPVAAIGAALALAMSLAASVQAAPTTASAFMTLVQGGFSSPVAITNAGDSRLFVVQQNGFIKIVGGGTFLDVHTRIACCGEQGLLGLAFHPDYNHSGMAGYRRFYVTYTRSSDGAIVLAEFKRSSGNVNTADPNSFRRLLVIPHPGQTNHNGGWIGFKPGSKLLFMSTGDGGGTGDVPNNAQNKSVLLGKILRINPLPSGSLAYTIPSTNPFVGRTGLDQIWAYGFRNPWRCSFDRGTGNLWCGDVGQAKYEEIDRAIAAGRNYGWHLLEGFHYYNWPGHTSGSLCTSTCRTLPIAEYAHTAFGGGNCAVTGGYVSRRSGALMAGKYVFADYCSGKMWTIAASFSGTLPSPVATAGFAVSCFGEGSDGRIYVCDYSNGAVYRVTDS
jgi:glucose/arabinose dehydrogenase